MDSKNIVMMIVGFGLGYGLATWLGKRKYEELIDSEVAELRAYYASKNTDKEKKEEVKEESSEEVVEDKDYKKIAKRYSRNYSDPSAEVKELQEAIDNEPHQPTIDERDAAPYIISDEAFYEEMPSYDKVSLFYYTVDDTLSDDQDQQIDDRYRLLGMEDIKPDEDPGTLYVRNERLMMDFEITFIYGSYKDCVCGPDEED